MVRQRALEAFGRIDVWFNNAGVDAFGSFLDIPSAAFERVLQVNLMGRVYGSRTALTQFRQQKAGTLINTVGGCRAEKCAWNELPSHPDSG
jgi:NAD(P)-dependent dehydrogenase (short-subunit alcohol dehydrogenase family)